MSSIYKKKESPYYHWTGYYEGKKLYKSTKMTNKKFANKIKEKWDFDLIMGDLSFLGIESHSNMSIEEYVTEYLVFVSKRKSEKSLKMAKGTLNRFSNYLSDAKVLNLGEIRVKDVNQYLDSLTKTKIDVDEKITIPVSPNTKRNHLIEISLMMKEAMVQELIPTNPAEKASLPKLTKSGINRLLDSRDLEIIFYNAGGWRFYYEFLYRTGLRAGDVAILKYGDIDRRKKVLTANIRKNKKVYELPLSDQLFAYLDLSKNPEDPIFPSLYSERDQGISDNISKPRKYLQGLLEPHGRRENVTLHSFRHTFNNTLRDLGLQQGDRNVLMAHASSEVNKLYTHPNVEVARDWINKLPKFNKQDIN